MTKNQTVDLSWKRYARKYDMLMTYNPFYQQLNKEVLERAENWTIRDGGVIVDMGAGTGNYSLPLASQFTHAEVIHIDGNEGMCGVTQDKKSALNISNLSIRHQDINEVEFKSNSLQALLCIHALYTFPNPGLILERMYDWLEPGGYGIFVNPGRIVKVLDWQIAIGWQMIMKHGIKKTLEIMQEGREVSYQNKQISKLQRDGTYWTHSHHEFIQTVKDAGFTILEARLCFRKISDMVVVSK